MNAEFLEVFEFWEREKGISREILVPVIEEVLLSAGEKAVGPARELRIDLDQKNGDIRVYAKLLVSDKVVSIHDQISVFDAQRIKADARVGDELEVEVTPVGFGRIAAQHAKRALVTNILRGDSSLAEIAHEQSEGSLDQRRPAHDRGYGTGFFITENGFLLTNHHVVEGAVHISALTRRGTLDGTVVKADVVNDLAILKLEGGFPALPLTSSRTIKLGDAVFTIGFPNPVVQGVEPKFTRGEISSLGGIRDDPRQFQISVPLQPGNSGGPLVDKAGNVVGIVVAGVSNLAVLEQTGSLPQGVNYAVKSSLAFTLLESVPELSNMLKEPHPAEGREFADVVSEVQEAVVLIAAD